MPDIFVHPGKLEGTIVPPPSKSDAHRALIAAALAGDIDAVSGLPANMPDDLNATIACLRMLKTGSGVLDCGESGTTLRFLVPVAAAMGAEAVFTGRGRLPERPLAEYKTILAGHGARLDFPEQGSLPLRIGGRLTGGVYQVPGNVSSQYISGLLFALPLLEEDSQIRLTTPLESAPYVAMTLHTLRLFGIRVDENKEGYFVPGRQKYLARKYEIEKDYSQAAFWLVAAYTGSNIRVEGLDPESLQGDKAIIQLLADFRKGHAKYIIDAAHIPDLVPALSVAAALTSAKTTIINAGRLRIKESDRLEAVARSLGDIGADIRQTPDGLEILGGALNRSGSIPAGGKADSFADHRIAMALSVAALSTRKGVLIRRAGAVNKSYPDFFSDLKKLGGVADEFNVGQ